VSGAFPSKKILPGTERGTIRRMGEGYARPRKLNDPVSRRFIIFQNVCGPNTNHKDVNARKPSVPALIVVDLPGLIVSRPVDFKAQQGRLAEKVEHIRANRMLPAELDAMRLAAQAPPQQDFRQRHRAAQTPGLQYGSPCSPEHVVFPSTAHSERSPSPFRGGSRYLDLPQRQMLTGTGNGSSLRLVLGKFERPTP
jgi:hypothetical protein